MPLNRTATVSGSRGTGIIAVLALVVIVILAVWLTNGFSFGRTVDIDVPPVTVSTD